jgi:hypothetical protein
MEKLSQLLKGRAVEDAMLGEEGGAVKLECSECAKSGCIMVIIMISGIPKALLHYDVVQRLSPCHNSLVAVIFCSDLLPVARRDGSGMLHCAMNPCRWEPIIVGMI